MNWLKEQISISPSFSPFLDQIDIIQKNVINNPSLSIEVCKSLIEGICKTILENKNIPYPDSIPFNGLVHQTINNILIPDENFNGDLVELGRRIASVAQELGNIRNNAGFAGHGMDIKNPKLTDTISIFSYKITDVLGGFIINCYNNNKIQIKDSRIHYCDCIPFNDSFDEDNPISVGSLNISASKALYEQDYEAYKEAYYDYIEELKRGLD